MVPSSTYLACEQGQMLVGHQSIFNRDVVVHTFSVHLRRNTGLFLSPVVYVPQQKFPIVPLQLHQLFPYHLHSTRSGCSLWYCLPSVRSSFFFK